MNHLSEEKVAKKPIGFSSQQADATDRKALHENITHYKIEQLILRRLDDRLNEGLP
jgi:hypothetical protein